MLCVSAKLLQHPVLLSSGCANMTKCQMIPIVGQVTVSSSRTREVGGIRVVWESQVQRRRQTKNLKNAWSPGETFERFEVDVVQGPRLLLGGDTVFEFVIQVPLALASTRTTHFDKVSHVLHAMVLDIPPCYDKIVSNNDRSSHWRSPLSLFSARGRARSAVFSSAPLLAHATTPLTVYQCNAELEGAAYNWRYKSDMNGLGILDLGVSSQHMVLGHHADLTVDLSALSPSTTIHSISTTLLQTTGIAQCPSKYSSSAAILSDTYEGRTEMLDRFELHSHGISWARMAGRARPYRGAYVWRGTEASVYTTDPMGSNDLPVDRHHPDGFGLSARLDLPSPIIGALPSTTHIDPAFASTSHLFVIRIEYSVLGEDVQGQPLPTDEEGRPVEGSVRSWSLEKEIELHSDLSLATSTATPAYSPSPPAKPVHDCTTEPSIECASIRLPRSVSLGWTKATMMRHVYTKEADLLVATRRHWEETGGLCACFKSREECYCSSQCNGGYTTEKNIT